MWFFYLFMIIMFLSEYSFGNMESVDKTDAKRLASLERFQWQSDLSEKEIEQILQALNSEKDTVVTTAIKVIALHHLDKALPKLKQGVGVSYGYSRILGELVAETFNADQKVIAQLRKKLITPLPADSDAEYKDATIPRETITSIIVIEEAKQLRAKIKQKPNLDHLSLSDFQKKLLHYSKMPEHTAILEMVEILAQSKIAGTEEYDMLAVLGTYGNEYVNDVLEKLSKNHALSHYGRLLLLDALKMQTSTMHQPQKERTRQILRQIELDNPQFYRSYAFRIDTLKSDLQ